MPAFFSNESVYYSRIRERMTLRRILNSTFQNGQIFLHVKKFIDNDILDVIQSSQSTKATQIINVIFSILEKHVKDKNQSLWMKLFTVHSLFKMCIEHQVDQSKYIFQILSDVVDKILIAFQEVKANTSKSEGFIARSLSKIKDSINQKVSSKSLSKFFSKNNDKNSNNGLNKTRATSQKSHQSSQEPTKQKDKDPLHKIKIQIQIQYACYLQKLLSDWPDLKETIGPHLLKKNKYQSQKCYKNIEVKMIWKLVNLFKTMQKVTSQLQRSVLLLSDFHCFVLATINYLSLDAQMLYDPIIAYITNESANIKDKIEIEKRNQSHKHVKFPIELESQVTELKLLLQELGFINQVVLYIFKSHHHYKYLYNKAKPQNFISLNDGVFDAIFQIASKIHQNKVFKNKIQDLRPLIAKDRQQQESEKICISKKVQRPSEQIKDNGPDSKVSRPSFLQMNAVKYKSAKLRQMMSNKQENKIKSEALLSTQQDLERPINTFIHPQSDKQIFSKIQNSKKT